MFLFWDTEYDRPEILGDDGNFWSYSEDHVAIAQNAPEKQCRYWIKMCKVSNVHPLNTSGRFEVYDPRLGTWGDLSCTHIKTYREIHELAGAMVDE